MASRRCTSGVTQLSRRANLGAKGGEIDRSAFDNALLTRNLERSRRERETPKKFRRTIPSWTPYNYVIATTAVCPKQKWRRGSRRGLLPRKPKTLLSSRRTSVSSETHGKRLLWARGGVRGRTPRWYLPTLMLLTSGSVMSSLCKVKRVVGSQGYNFGRSLGKSNSGGVRVWCFLFTCKNPSNKETSHLPVFPTFCVFNIPAYNRPSSGLMSSCINLTMYLQSL